MCKPSMLAQAVCFMMAITNVHAVYLMQKIARNTSSFANNVAISNDFCVISAPTDPGGAVYIYKYNSIENEWDYTQTINLTDGRTCGRSASIFKNYIIIGCTGSDEAYIYKLNETSETNETWYELSIVTVSQHDFFGYSVDITDGYAIVGDYGSNQQANDAGSSHIFIQTFDELTGEESWIYDQSIYASDPEPSDEFGESVSISYDYAIVGAHYDDDNGVNSGSAHIFKLNKTTMIWEHVIKLSASNDTDGYQFGMSVSIDSIYGLAIVGAKGGGLSYIYQRDDESGIWNEATILSRAANGDLAFGYSVAIYNETCIIGNNNGAAYEFESTFDQTTNTTSWQQKTRFTASDGENDGSFGSYVDVFDDFVAIAAENEGAVYIYAGIAPTRVPTSSPSLAPTISPVLPPTIAPTTEPTETPSMSPSVPPTMFPTTIPTTTPSIAPTNTPSSSPTNPYCDDGLQTQDTFMVCNFLFSFDIIFDFLNEEDYCDNSDFFQCSYGNSSITHVFLSNNSISGSFNFDTTFYLNQVISHGSLFWLDLSNNEIGDEISDWSVFSKLEYLSLANNKLQGSVDFEQLVSNNNNNNNNGSSLIHLDLNNNSFSQQTISWNSFKFMPNLEYIDISNNQFNGEIEISYFEYCKNLKYFNVGYNKFTSFDYFDESISNTYMTQIEEFIFNNNEIDEPFDIQYFSNNNNLKKIECNNNELTNGKLDISEFPLKLETFICGDNDFGEFVWYSSPYDDYNLKHIDLTNAHIYGQITMKFFDPDDGGYKYLEYVDLSNNHNLNISINFVYLDGQGYLYYLNFLNTDSNGYVDFNYISDSVTIKLEDDVYCVDSYCSGDDNGNIYGYTRNYETCHSREECLDSCNCATAYTLGLETFIPSEARQISFVVLIVTVSTLLVIVILGKLHAKGIDSKMGMSIGIKSDYFEMIGFIGFIFQIWDFFSDLLLCFDMFDHYDQSSINNPDKDDYLKYFIVCSVFIFVPWFVNLIFLIKTKRGWEKESIHHIPNVNFNLNANGKSRRKLNLGAHEKIDALSKSLSTTSKWLNKYSKILVGFCMLCGGVTPSLKVVNSNLFGLKQFNMGLPKYKQDENARHRLWLTVILENVPQIFISTLYARNLVGFDTTVLGAFVSSVASVVLALLSAYLEYPKKYYIYQTTIQLKSIHNPQLRKRLRMRKTLAHTICESMDREKGLLFVENIYYTGKDFICFNVVSNEHVTYDFITEKKFIKLLFENELLRIKAHKVYFTFVDFKRVELSLKFACNKSSKKSADGDNTNTDNNEQEIEFGMTSEPKRKRHIHSESTTFSTMNDFNVNDLVIDDRMKISGVSVDGATGVAGLSIAGTGASTPDSTGRGGVYNGAASGIGDKKDWQVWTCRQVNAWVEIELRKGLGDMRILEEKRDVEFVDEELEMLIDKFMLKFESLTLSGSAILAMKKNVELRDSIKKVMNDESIIFWFVVSNAIDSLQSPNNDNNDSNNNDGVNDMDQLGLSAHLDVVDDNVYQESVQLLS